MNKFFKKQVTMFLSLAILFLGTKTIIVKATTELQDDKDKTPTVLVQGNQKSVESVPDANNTEETKVKFNDPNLEAAIREVLKKPTGDITIEDMYGIEQLEAPGRGIKDLTGLEYAENLIDLRLPENEISDISPIRYLRKLYNLELYKNKISDVAPLRHLKKLGMLDLSNNEISDTKPLSELMLSHLSLSHNRISDIVELKNIPMAPFMMIDDNYLDITEGSEVYKYIKELENQVTYIRYEPQKSITGVTLEKKEATMEEEERIVKFNDPNLEAVIRETLNKPTGYITSEEMLDIKELKAMGREIKELTGLEYAIDLEYLDLSQNNISDITVIRNMSYLTTLIISGNQISNIDALRNLTDLQNLMLSQNKINDIKALRYLINLGYLKINDNEVKDITALRDLTNLNSLDLRNNKISDITVLKNLVFLDDIDLSQNEISEITALIDLVNNVQSAEYSSMPYDIDLRENFLDIAEGTKDYNDIQTLKKTVTMVLYKSQKQLEKKETINANGIANGTVLIGNKVYDLEYANNIENFEEVRQAIINSNGQIYIKNFNGIWMDNMDNIIDVNVVEELLMKMNKEK